MAMRDDIKSVLTEISPILAGFKLGAILLTWIGLGSFAKWIIENWYPFTRWVWDQFTLSLHLPELPIIVKDTRKHKNEHSYSSRKQR